MKVKEVMKNPKIIAPSSNIREAASIMNKNRIGSLIVTNEKKVIGIITERDILAKVTATNKLPSKVLVEEIMTPKVITISPDQYIDDAVYLMLKHKIKKLPVVEENKLVNKKRFLSLGSVKNKQGKIVK